MFQIVPCNMSDLYSKYHENPFIRFFSVLVLTHKDFLEENYIMKPCIEGIIHTTFQIFQIVPFILPNISWKLHENLSMRFPVMLLTDKQTYR